MPLRPRRSARLFWQMKTALGRFQADAIVTVSDYSRDGIIKHFGLDPARVFVVGEAADPVFRRLDHPVATPKLRSVGIDGSRRTAVYMGGFSPHKNLEALVAAFSYDDRVLLERYVKGRELAVSVLDGEPLPIVEAIPREEDFFNFEARYDHGALDARGCLLWILGTGVHAATSARALAWRRPTHAPAAGKGA